MVQDANKVNLAAGRGVAVREFVLKPPHGRVDYLLFVDGKAVGVIEAKPEGATLTGVEWQTAKYVDGLPDWVQSALEGALPFAYQSTGVETRFTNTLDPEPRAAQVFWFHRPETLAGWLDESGEIRLAPTLRAPAAQACRSSMTTGLWPAQATRDPQPRGVARDEPAARADPDGDRLGQDVHRREHRLPADQVRRRATRSCSSSTGRTSAGRR